MTHRFQVEFHDTIETSIPALVLLLENKSQVIRSTASALIFNLSQYRKLEGRDGLLVANAPTAKLRNVIGASIFTASLPPALSGSNEAPNLFIHDVNTEAHQVVPSSRVPPQVTGSSHNDFKLPVAAQLWRLLGSKESRNLQRGIQTLSQLAKICKFKCLLCPDTPNNFL